MIRPKFRYGLALLTALTATPRASAQSRAIEVAAFPGLADTSRATALREGRDGRIWAAFRGRVQSHDGERVATIDLAPDAEGRTPAVIRALEVGHDDSLWIGTERGLWRLAVGMQTAHHWPGSAELNVMQLVGAGDDLWVRSSRSLAVCRSSGRIEPIDAPGGSRSVGGLLAGASGVWAWTRIGIWRRDHDASAWTPMPWAPDGMRHVFLAGELVVCATADALLEFAPDGTPRRTIACEHIGSTTEAALDADTYWLAGYDRVLAVDRRAGTVRPVELWQRGLPLENATVYSLLVDAQGLLWLCTSSGVCRSRFSRAIDNVVLPGFERQETVASLAELPHGEMLLGTSRGALWQQAGAGWRRLDTPWPAADAERTPHVDVLVAIADDLYAGIQDGLWRRRAATWQRIGADAGIGRLRVAFADADGTLWSSDRDKVWRLGPDDALTCVPLQPVAGVTRPSVSGFHRDAHGTLWVGAIRCGLGRLDATDTVVWDDAWRNDAVLAVSSTHDAARLWLMTTDGLWSYDPATGERALLRQVARSNLPRNLVRDDDGRLWLTTSQHLLRYDPAGGDLRELSARLGTHPLGHQAYASLLRRNGEVWFGATRGYSRIVPATLAEPAPRSRLARLDVSVAGTPRPAATAVPGQVDLIADEPLDVHAVVIDRSLDGPLSRSYVLRHRQGNTTLTSHDGAFAPLDVGDYDLDLVLQHASGEIETLALGRVRARRRATMRPLLVSAIVCLLGLVAWSLRSPHVRRRVASRHVSITRLLDRSRDDPSFVLDVAFLVTTVAEQCMHRVAARHASVWMLAPERDAALKVAEFGASTERLRRLAHRCRTSGTEIAPDCRLLQHRGRTDLCLRLRASDEVEMEILLGDLSDTGDPALADLRTIADAARANLQRQRLLHRLQADLARRDASLAADAHDIRGPLTALRMSSHYLTDLLQDGDERMRDAAATISSATERVVAAIDHLVSRQHRASRLRLQRLDAIAIVERSAQSWGASARARDLRIVVDDGPRPLFAQIDENWLARVLDNLIENALKYSPDGGTVRVRWERRRDDGDVLLVHVEDEGPGFTANELESVFLPGTTGVATPAAGGTQSGFGLWIARQAMRSMGGDVWIDPQVARGARVSLRLPLQPAVGGDMPGAAQRAADGPGR